MTQRLENLQELLDSDFGGIQRQAAITYLKRLIRHVQCVEAAGLYFTGPYCLNIIGELDTRLSNHDADKFEVNNFCTYAEFKYGGKNSPELRQAYHDVRQSHVNNNDHHFEYFTGENTQVPFGALLELIADWHGANAAYNGTYDLSDWFNTHAPMYMWPINSGWENTKAALLMVLGTIGYRLTPIVEIEEVQPIIIKHNNPDELNSNIRHKLYGTEIESALKEKELIRNHPNGFQIK